MLVALVFKSIVHAVTITGLACDLNAHEVVATIASVKVPVMLYKVPSASALIPTTVHNATSAHTVGLLHKSILQS